MPRGTFITDAELLAEARRIDLERLRTAERDTSAALIERVAQVGRLRLRVRQLEMQLRRHGIEPEPEQD